MKRNQINENLKIPSDGSEMRELRGAFMDAMSCSLSALNDAARRYRKEHFQRANADPTDTEAREAYHYEEGRTRAYSEGMNALDDQRAVARQRIEALKDHCRQVNPTWAWLMREVLEIVDPQSPENS